MALNKTTQKRIREAGWFYHAPAKKENQEEVLVPPASQIPGLNYSPEGPKEEPARLMFKDTDTKYIRFAKQGGRQNLLQFKENPNMSERPPKGYPRSEWFYLEDNAMEDAAEKPPPEKYLFKVPEYMAHDEHQPTGDDYERPGKAPYAHDRLSAYNRDGGNRVTDKTIRLPEVRQAGYGVRSAKPLRIKSHPAPERARPSQAAKMSQLEMERPHLKYLPLPEDEAQKAKMTELLSYGYDKKWHDQVEIWQSKQDRIREKHKNLLAADPNHNKDKVTTEYKNTIGKQQQPAYKMEKGRKMGNSSSAKSMGRQVKVTSALLNNPPVETEPFKLSKFKNVPSKVDHIQKDIPVAAH